MKPTTSEEKFIEEFLLENEANLKTAFLIRKVMPKIIHNKVIEIREALIKTCESWDGFEVNQEKADWSFDRNYNCFIRIKMKKWPIVFVKIENQSKGFNNMIIGVVGRDQKHISQNIDSQCLDNEVGKLNIGSLKSSRAWFVYTQRQDFKGENDFNTLERIFFDTENLVKDLADDLHQIAIALDKSIK